MGATESALALEDVSAGYGRGTVLDGVSMQVAAGEVVGLVGPNGSGKTTLIRVASRALAPRSGRVRLLGRDPYSMSARECARTVAVVPQDLVPAFPFSALEVVLMGRAPYGSVWRGSALRDWARAREAMETTGVQHLADRPIDELSGGERQRVILAQALAQDAPVLLLDEPTTHLDLKHILDLLATLRGLARQDGKTVLAVFHDLNLASVTCDRMLAMHEGRVVAEGSPRDVITTELLRSVYGVEAEVEIGRASGRPMIDLEPPTPAPRPSGRLRAHVVGGAGRGGPLMRSLAERGYEVSAGILHDTDSDALLADRLNLVRVTVPPFSGIDQESERACASLMSEAEVVFVCDAPFGPGNVANLRLALDAAEEGVRCVLIQEVPMNERDFTHGEASDLWKRLEALATVVGSTEEGLAELGRS